MVENSLAVKLVLLSIPQETHNHKPIYAHLKLAPSEVSRNLALSPP